MPSAPVAPIPIAILTDFPLEKLLPGHEASSQDISTPFGSTSSPILILAQGNRKVALVQRQGEHRQINRNAINYSANFFALKQLGVKFVISLTEALSLREMIKPGTVCIPGQIVPGLCHEHQATFFGDGIAAQVDLHYPVCSQLQTLLFQSAKIMGADAHWNTILLALGAAGSATKSESDAYRRHACDVITPLSISEARLALEAEMSYAVLGIVTHYAHNGPVPEKINEVHAGMIDLASATLSHLALHISPELQAPAHTTLDRSILTPRQYWPAATAEKLSPLLKRFL